MSKKQTFAIVGASLAGAKAAETLRSEGFDGRVVLIGAERERPYERPPLSKDYLRGESPREKAYVHPESFYEENDIELRTSTPATKLDMASSELVLEGGELEHGGKLVVIGAGWIGAEVGASARDKGLEVTIVEQASVPLERALGPEVGAIYADIHRDHDVELLTGTGLEAFEGERAVERMRLADGRTIDCDFVVVGVGVALRTQLAEAAGIDTDNGIAVSERLETSATGIFAAGDVANAWHPFYRRSIRVEHWANALNQGPAAAGSMLGNDEPYERLPYFFSDQYDVGMEYSGYAMSCGEDPRRAPERTRAAGSVGEFVAQGAGFVKHFVRGRLSRADATPASELASGEAAVLQVDGDKLGVYRDEQGSLHAVSAVCTHLGCVVEWNRAERTWDCPCHGSRFRTDGGVIQGPAKRDLERRELPGEGPPGGEAA